MRKLLLSYLILFSTFIFAQKEANNWYFGHYAGVTFNSGAPVALTNGQLYTLEGCSSISDPNGNLLFYTDGIQVWNRNHTVMPNGSNLKGDPSSTQSGIIVPKPGSSTIYYIFTVDMQGGQALFLGGDADGVSNGFMYSEVDMTLNGGLGDIVLARKNVPLKKPTTEGLSAVKKANGVDYWVVTHGCNNNQYYAFSVTAAGVNTVPVQSNVGPNVTVSALNYGSGAIGYTKISPNGKKIAACHAYENNQVVISDFNTATGVVSNSITIGLLLNGNSQGPYGVEFSNCNEYLYVSELFEGSDAFWGTTWPGQTNIWRFDLNAGSIPASKTLFRQINNEMCGALQLAADGAIYMPRVVRTGTSTFDYGWGFGGTLHRINNPRVAGATFTANAVNLAGKVCAYGLPPFIASFFYNSSFSTVNVSTGDTSLFCKPDSILFKGTTNVYDSIRWIFGDPSTGAANTSILLNPKHLFSAPGSYTVYFYKYLCGFKDSAVKNITIYAMPVINDIVDQTICTGGSLLLDATGSPVTSYTWSTGAVTPTITVSTAGKYVVTASNNGCLAKDSMVLTLTSPMPVSVTASPDKNNICPGTSVTFTAVPTNGGAAPAYQWYVNGAPVGTNSNTYTSTTLNNTDQVTVKLTSNLGCVSGNPATSVPVAMIVNAPVPVSVTASADKNNICPGTNVTFTAVPTNGGAAPTYQWYVNGVPAGTNSNTYTSTTLINADQVTVKLTSNLGCVSGNPATSVPVAMIVTTPLPVSVTASADKNNVCQGTSITFTAVPTNGGAAPSYQWFVNGSPAGTNSNTYTTTTLNNNDQVTVQLTSNAGCVSGNPAISTPVLMIINSPQPVSVTATPDKNNICVGTNVTFTASPTNGGTTPSYQWYVNGSPVGTNSNTYSSTLFNNNDQVTVQLTSNATCISGNPSTSTPVVMTVNSPPVANAGADKVLTCSTQTIGTPAIAGNTYSWSPSAGLNNPLIAQPDASLANTYTLTVTNIATGCKATDAVSVTGTILIPSVNAGSDQTLTCSVTSVTLGIAGVAGNSYSWSPAAGLSNASIAQPSANVPNTYILTVTNTTSGCSLNDTVLVSQNGIPPVANAGADQVLTCTTTSVTLGTAGVAGNSYSWTPSAGLNTSSIAQPTASAPNTYTLTVTNTANGCTSSDAVTITQNITPPVSNAGSDQTLTCSTTSFTLGTAVVGGNSYSWTPSAGLSNASIAQPTASAPNTYTLTVTNIANGCTSSDAVAISQNITPPVSNAGADQTLTCSTTSVTLGTASIAGNSYSWTPSSGLNTASIAQPTAGAPNTYTLTVTNTANGCTATDAVTVSQDITPPVANAGADQVLTCAIPGITIGTAAIAGNSYSWTPSAGLNNGSIAQPSAISPNTFTLTVTNTTNGCTSSDAVTVTQSVTPPVANAGSDKTLTCSIPSVTIGTAAVAGNTYSWTPAAGLDDATLAQPIASAPNTYSLTVTNTATGCTSTDAVTISRDITPPVVDAGAGQTLTCTTTSVTIGTASISGNTYSWSPAAGLNNASLAQPAANAPNTYTLTVTNTANGCTATDAVVVSQDITPPVANAGSDQTLTCSVTNVTLGTAGVAGNSYSWSPAAGLSNALIAQPSANAPNTYTLTVTNTTNGCTSTDAVLVSQDITAPVANAGADQVLTCTTTSVTLGTAGVAGNSYSWTPSAGLNTSSIAQPTASAPNTYTLTVTNTANGCTSSDAVTITQNITPPVSNAGSDQTLTCSTTSFTLGTAVVGGNSYSWTPSAGLSNASIAQPTASAPNTYTLTVTNIANGCTSSDAVAISQNITPPVSNAGADQTLTCSTTSVTLGTASIAGNSYSWTPSAGLNTASIAQPTAGAPNTYTLTVTNTVNGCTATDAVTVSQDITPPVANAGADQVLTCAIPGITIGTAAIAGNSYSWTPSAGLNNGSIAQPSAISPNTFTLTVTNTTNGCTSSDAVTVTQSVTPPVANAGSDKTLTCSIPSVTIGTAAVAGNTYSWTPAAGLDDATLAQPIASAPNTYTLTVTNTATGCTSTDAVTISRDITPPVVDAGAGQTLTCTTTSVTIGTASISGNTYSWSPAAGLNNASLAQPAANAPNTYTLTVTNTANGCTAADSVLILQDIVHPVANAGSDQTLTCSDTILTIGTPEIAGNKYSWFPSSQLNDPSIGQPKTSIPDVYTVTVTNISNGCSSSDAVFVRQNILVSAAIAGSDEVLTCTATGITIGAPAQSGNSYSWSPTAGLDNALIAQPVASSPNTYTLTVTNLANGCTSNDVVTISQDISVPTVDAGPDKILTCSVKSVTLGTTALSGTTYTWVAASRLSATNTAQPSAVDTGIYLITATKTSNGCTATDSVSVLIDTIAPLADAGADQIFPCPYGPVTLGSISNPNYTYHWTAAKGLHTLDEAQPLTDSAGTFSLYVINTVNGCKSLEDTAVILPKNCECTFFVPSAFTPNYDGLNDILSPFRYCDDVKDFSFSVFNRWGELVYFSKDMDTAGWDGFYKSESQQEDSYVWVINYFDVLNNESKVQKGMVVLIK